MLIQARVEKINGDLHQMSGIRYVSISFSVRYLISIAYWKGLISGVKLFVVVPQAIRISLRNRIGDSAGDRTRISSFADHTRVFLVVSFGGFIGIQCS